MAKEEKRASTKGERRQRLVELVGGGMQFFFFLLLRTYAPRNMDNRIRIKIRVQQERDNKKLSLFNRT